MTEQSENKPTPKETSHGLPVVTQATIDSIWQHYTTVRSWDSHLEEVKTRLIIENPELVKFIESQVSKYPSVIHNSMFEVIVAAIAILEHQAEANKLASKFKFENTDNP